MKKLLFFIILGVGFLVTTGEAQASHINQIDNNDLTGLEVTLKDSVTGANISGATVDISLHNHWGVNEPGSGYFCNYDGAKYDGYYSDVSYNSSGHGGVYYLPNVCCNVASWTIRISVPGYENPPDQIFTQNYAEELLQNDGNYWKWTAHLTPESNPEPNSNFVKVGAMRSNMTDCGVSSHNYVRLDGVQITQNWGSPSGSGGFTPYDIHSTDPIDVNLSAESSFTNDDGTFAFRGWCNCDNNYGDSLVSSCNSSASGGSESHPRAIYEYSEEVNNTLTVRSMIDGSQEGGLSVSQTSGFPNGMGGTTGSNGTYSRTHDGDINVTLEAPLSFEGGEFVRWSEDSNGCQDASGRYCYIDVIGGDSKMPTAYYETPDSSFNVRAYESELASCSDGSHGGMSPIQLYGVEASQFSGSPWGMGGHTYFSHDSSSDIDVWLRADAMVGDREFRMWCNCDSVSGRECNIQASGGEIKEPRAFYSPASVENTLSVESYLDGAERDGLDVTQLYGDPSGMGGETGYSRSSGSDITTTLQVDETFQDGEFVRWEREDGSECTSGVERGCDVSISGGNSEVLRVIYETPEEHELTVDITGDGEGFVGSVSPSDPVIECGNNCEEIFDHGTPVTLEAQADGGSHLESWGGACSGVDPSDTCEVIMNGPRTVEATFELTSHQLTINKQGDGEGTVEDIENADGVSCPAGCDNNSHVYQEGSLVVLSSEAESGSSFVSWGGDCSGFNTSEDCTFIMDEEKTVSVLFQENPKPYVINMRVGSGDYCRSAQAPLRWDYNDDSGLSQNGFHVQINENTASFGDPDIDSNVVDVPPGGERYTPGGLKFDQLYHWRVRVRNSDGTWSDWEQDSFETDSRSPQPAFIWDPDYIEAGDEVQFIDDTEFAPGSTSQEWFWEFGDGATSSDRNPVHTYAPGQYSVRLSVQDNFGQCEVEEEINVMVPLPEWEEVSPFK